MNRARACVTAGVFVIGGLVAASAAQAQVADTTRDSTAFELPPIEVVGSIQPSAGPTVGSGVPARVTTLDAEEVDAYEPRVLSDALRGVAGLSTYDDLGSPYKLNISSRGFYSSPVVGLPQGVAVFLDGVRMNEPEASQVNFDLLPMDHIQRIEVLSGNGSLLGRNALGGAINLVTARGRGPIQSTLEASGGSFGSFRGESNVSGLTKGGMDWYVGGNYNREDGWRQVTSAEQYSGFINLGKLGETSGIRFQALYGNSFAQTAGSLPETIFATSPDSNLSAQDYEDLWSFQGVAAGLQAGRGRGRRRRRVYFRRHRAERFNANQPDDPDVFGISYNSTFGYTADYRWVTLLSDNAALNLRGGVDGSVSRVSIDIFADSIKFGGTRTITTQARSPLWDIAPFVMADLTTGPVTLSAGARFDYFRLPFENLLDPSRRHRRDLQAVQPAGRGQRGRSHRGRQRVRVMGQELPCAGGDRERLRGSRVALPAAVRAGRRSAARAGQGEHDRGRASATPRRTWRSTARCITPTVRNDIFLTPYGGEEPTGSTIDGYFINLDKTRRVGFELGAAYRFPAGSPALPQLRLHPRHLPERGGSLQHPRGDGGGGRGEEGRRSRIRSRPSNEVTPGQPPAAGARSRHQGRCAGADRPVLLRRRRRPLHRQAVSARRRGERHQPSSTTTS